MNEVARVLLSLLPVVVFLIGLVLLDSFKLVSRSSVAVTIGAGMGAALLSYAVNLGLMEALAVDRPTYSRYIAPVAEEFLKTTYVVYLIRSRRVGFLVDAAIYGFAMGAGFALFENVYFLRELQETSLWLWGVRGFGTAIMHGSATAIFAMLAKGLTDRHQPASDLWFLPGLGAAVVIHSLYNHVLLPPVLTTLILVVLMPLLIVVIYERSERATRNWLGVGFDNDVELLETILEGGVGETPVGRFLESLKSRFPGEVVADLLCLLQVHLELSIRAKGVLMAREVGLDAPVDESVKANLQELRYLEKAVGKTGQMAIDPFRVQSSHDLWQIYMLGK